MKAFLSGTMSNSTLKKSIDLTKNVRDKLGKLGEITEFFAMKFYSCTCLC